VWLVSIARNMAIDHVRSAQARFATRLRPMEEVEQLSMAGAAHEPESAIDRSRAVNAGFANLTANEKQVLELAYFEGCSQTEIAERLREPLGTVKSWTRSALSRMRKVIQEGGAK
jgi:RNA polymerase sigma-70 factor, ECF subfamily